jgi:hypothetical protein
MAIPRPFATTATTLITRMLALPTASTVRNGSLVAFSSALARGSVASMALVTMVVDITDLAATTDTVATTGAVATTDTVATTDIPATLAAHPRPFHTVALFMAPQWLEDPWADSMETLADFTAVAAPVDSMAVAGATVVDTGKFRTVRN